MISKGQKISKLFFMEYYKKSTTAHTPHFILKKSVYNDLRPKFSVIISKKTAKLAVTRNHIKRLIYNFLKTKNLKNLYFITLKKNILDIPTIDWQNELNKVLE